MNEKQFDSKPFNGALVCYVFLGVKKRHDLEPGKYPHVSKRKMSLSELVDIDGMARYWLVKLHGS